MLWISAQAVQLSLQELPKHGKRNIKKFQVPKSEFKLFQAQNEENSYN